MKTRFGEIKISPYMISQVVSKSAMESYGVVELSKKSIKSKIKSMITRSSASEGVDVEITENDQINLKVHIFVEYGVNIPEVTRNLADRIRYDVNKLLGLTVSSIDVVIEGVKD
ncbi:MAG: Asp23/Gls24 family envelope stress response protein [Actinobacteria bacterium]|nr:Asp23/Gls24 family envelope stress response protein [Actinomycetota bacterium]